MTAPSALPPLRLALFSPMPPVRSGVADCSAELVGRLRQHHAVDVFVEAGTQGQAGARSAHDFVWLHRQRPYDLVIYQLGNSAHHAYAWAYLFRYPGLVVLHDVHLHHARAASLLHAGRLDDYRTEFRWNHPDANPDEAELAVAGFDTHLYYAWPMTRLVIGASRAVAVHTEALRTRLARAHPDAVIETVRLGHGRLVEPEEARRMRDAVRKRHGISDEAAVFGCFGSLSPDKRIPAVLDAFARTRAQTPGVHLLLAGPVPAYYDLHADIRARDLGAAVTVTGYLASEDELTSYITACDVALNLRWPTAREISGPWLRCLAAGRPTVITHLGHMTDPETLDPRTWQPFSGGSDSEAIAVAIDLLDEAHSLRLALGRLAGDAGLRQRLGAAGRSYWKRHHDVEAMAGDYLRVIARAASMPPPVVGLPAHLQDEGAGTMAAIVRRFELPSPLR